jgi:hypothetical protein
MDQELEDLFYDIPAGAADYADLLEDLDDADIPRDRIPKFVALMETADAPIAFDAAKVLCSWGDERGFEYLRAFVMRDPPMTQLWNPHRYRAYDETYRLALMAFIQCWAKWADRSPKHGEEIRAAMFAPVVRIIQLAEKLPVPVDNLFWLITREGFTEYLPAFKHHLEAILEHPERHHWKVADCADLLMKFDPEFGTQALAKRGKTLADYPTGRKP